MTRSSWAPAVPAAPRARETHLNGIPNFVNCSSRPNWIAPDTTRDTPPSDPHSSVPAPPSQSSSKSYSPKRPCSVTCIVDLSSGTRLELEQIIMQIFVFPDVPASSSDKVVSWGVGKVDCPWFSSSSTVFSSGSVAVVVRVLEQSVR